MPHRARVRRALVLSGLALAAGGAVAQAELVLGVLPNISSVTLAAQYERLKAYVEKQDGTRLRIVLPGSFKAFFDATLRGDFDLAVAAPHFARVAQIDAQLVPLVMYEPRTVAQLITLADGPLAGASGLRGKALALANPSSLVAMYGQQWLRSQGLEPGRDVELRAARTDMGVGACCCRVRWPRPS